MIDDLYAERAAFVKRGLVEDGGGEYRGSAETFVDRALALHRESS